MDKICGLFCLNIEGKCLGYYDMIDVHFYSYKGTTDILWFILRALGESNGKLACTSDSADTFLNLFGLDSINITKFGVDKCSEMKGEMNKMLSIIKDHIPRSCNCGQVSSPAKYNLNK